MLNIGRILTQDRLLRATTGLNSIEEFIEHFPTVREVIIDGTERPISRPKDAEKRRKQSEICI